ncbi:hypothetical protein NY10_2385 [Carnobacterium antarcticum]|nr:hypothetical protein NY10_2385 [Carnobacterium sp. CP1]
MVEPHTCQTPQSKGTKEIITNTGIIIIRTTVSLLGKFKTSPSLYSFSKYVKIKTIRILSDVFHT